MLKELIVQIQLKKFTKNTIKIGSSKMEELKTENLLNLEETIAKGIFKESKYPHPAV